MSRYLQQQKDHPGVYEVPFSQSLGHRNVAHFFCHSLSMLKRRERTILHKAKVTTSRPKSRSLPDTMKQTTNHTWIWK